MLSTERVTDELLEMIRRETGRPDLAYAESPAPLTGGFWAELLSFRLEGAPPGWDGPLVARLMPNPQIAAKETAFQTQVARQGYPTPRVHASGGPDPGIDGRAYLVMDRAPGVPLLAGLDGLTAIARVPSLARTLPARLAGVLADLHRLDPAPVEHALGAEAVAAPSLEAMIESLQTAATAMNRSDLIAAMTWLGDHLPLAEPSVLCHGDLHPFNVLADDDGTVTVLDWSAAQLAPATYDLGFTSLVLAEPPLVVPGTLRPVVQLVGSWLSRSFVRAYERAADVRVDQAALRWHQSLICIRALVEVATWVAAGEIDHRGGHPWVISGSAFASRLRRLTGAPVVPR
jgi:aminoglycoside phosphotransferase (APT) family kinase protein